jgi:hypothetical protein
MIAPIILLGAGNLSGVRKIIYKKEAPMMETRNQKHQDEPYQSVFNQRRNKQEIEECVVFARLELYNRAMPCGPKAVQDKLKMYQVNPLPSESTISHIMARRGLTDGRTGFKIILDGKTKI